MPIEAQWDYRFYFYCAEYPVCGVLWEFSTGQIFREKMSLDVRMPQSDKQKDNERFINNRNIFQTLGKLLLKIKEKYGWIYWREVQGYHRVSLPIISNSSTVKEEERSSCFLVQVEEKPWTQQLDVRTEGGLWQVEYSWQSLSSSCRNSCSTRSGEWHQKLLS